MGRAARCAETDRAWFGTDVAQADVLVGLWYNQLG